MRDGVPVPPKGRPAISRREILLAGGGSLALAGLNAMTQRAGATPQRGLPTVPALVMADISLAGFAAVHRAARGAGIPLLPFEGELGSVWLDHLEPLWRRAPHPIVGATFGGAFFCAEQLAQDRGLMRGFALSAPLSERALGDSARLAISTVARPVQPLKRAGILRPDLPVVWALVPRAYRQGGAR
jgi:hypothetical protein